MFLLKRKNEICRDKVVLKKGVNLQSYRRNVAKLKGHIDRYAFLAKDAFFFSFPDVLNEVNIVVEDLAECCVHSFLFNLRIPKEYGKFIHGKSPDKVIEIFREIISKLETAGSDGIIGQPMHHYTTPTERM